MTVLDHLSPFWSETKVASGRGNVGTGLFDRVFFVDVFDGPQGQARVRNLALAAGASRLSQVISSGHEVALEEDRSAMLLLPQSGQIFCAVGARDLVALPGQAMVLPRGHRRTVTLRDGDQLFRAFVLRLAGRDAGPGLTNGAVLDLADLADLSEAARLISGLARPGVVEMRVLEEHLRAAETLAAGSLAEFSSIMESPPRLKGTDRALRRAEALLREGFDDDITISEVADRAGLSMRQLQSLFARNHGLSPHAWLTRLRLEQAHVQLKGATPVPSVTEAAMSAGFTHLGRFPAQYRARFGTLPSVERVAVP